MAVELGNPAAPLLPHTNPPEPCSKPGTCTVPCATGGLCDHSGLPSAEDLDRVAEEQRLVAEGNYYGDEAT